MNSTSTANSRQVAGTHYVAVVQHWDFVVQRKHNYIEAQVSRYVTRWFKKDGLKDLRKARHFVQKLQELAPIYAREDQWWRNVLRWAKAHTKAPLPVPTMDSVSVEEYVVANGLDVNGPEHQVIECIDDWVRGGRTNPERLRDADFLLTALIGRLEDGVADTLRRKPEIQKDLQNAHRSASEATAAPAPAAPPEVVTLHQTGQQLMDSGAEPGVGYVNQDRGGNFAGGGASGSWESSSSSSDSGSSDSGGSSGD